MHPEYSLDWARSTLNQLGYEIHGDVRLIRDMPWSRIDCFNTSQGRVYLKSMDKPFAIEPVLLKFLFDKISQNITEIIASNNELHCFLMKDAGVCLRGVLKNNYDLGLFCKALQKCAEIQLKCIDHIDELLSMGVNDWRLRNMPKLYEDFIARTDLLSGDGMTDFEIKQLKELLPKFRALCNHLEGYGIPETLEHGDFHDNNVLVKDGVITINDWGDSFISHPFISLALALDSARRNHGMQEDSERYVKARDTYLVEWVAYGNEALLLKSFELVKTLKHLVFAMSFSRIKLCPGIEKFPELNGYVADSMRGLIRLLSL
jgi:hypothetical protein